MLRFVSTFKLPSGTNEALQAALEPALHQVGALALLPPCTLPMPRVLYSCAKSVRHTVLRSVAQLTMSSQWRCQQLNG